MTRLSVCVPTYNGARFLRPCLESLLAQELPPGLELEVIVGDDASTDASVAVARALADPRIRVHPFPVRQGLAGNWNRTLRLAGGDHVALVGQDDRVEPRWAASLVGLLEEHPEADLAFGRRRFEFEDEESRRVVGDFFERRYPEMLAPFYAAISTVNPPEWMVEQALRFSFEINLIGEPSFVVLRRRNAAVAQGFDTRMAQMIDWEFFTRFFVERPVVHCPEVVGTYHIHARASSIENAPLSRHYREYHLLLEVLRGRFAALLTAEEDAQLRRRQEEVAVLARTWAEKEARERETLPASPGPQGGRPGVQP